MTMLAELQQVTKYYGLPGSDHSSRVLHEISLQIAECENIAIVGPSGSGKSTLLNILGTLDSPTSGRVLLKGISVNDMDESRLAETRNKDIGFVFQMHYLLPQLTLLENILLPLLPQKDKILQKNAHEQALQLIHRVGLSKQLHKFPSQLSGGECQRTAVVRALINRPALLLADEPTGALDQKSSGNLTDLLIELNKEEGVALVVVTHSMEVAKKMDRIYQLENGKLQESKP